MSNGPDSSTGSAPSSKQRRMLAFFGRTAKSAREAHDIISACLADPVEGRRWLLERARMVLDRCPDLRRAPGDPQDSHAVLFSAAATLVHGFALDEGEAWPLLRDYANRSDLPWSDHEVQYKLGSAARSNHDKQRGHMIGDQFATRPESSAKTAPAATKAPAPTSARKPKIAYDPQRLAILAKEWREVVNLPWLADRSAVDPALVTTDGFLRTLYRAGEKILCFNVFKSQGQALWPAELPPQIGEDGVWFLPQPVSGLSLPNPRSVDRKTGLPKMSRRSEESVREFRYLVLESDQAEARDWLGFIVRLPLRIEALYTSAGRSIHALVKVNCASKAQFDAYKERLRPTLNLLALGGVDEAVFSCVRLTRLPCCWRQGSRDEQDVWHPYKAGPRLQKLLYLRPTVAGEKVRPICEIPPVRDVVGHWCEVAAWGPKEVDASGKAPGREIARALDFYAPASRRIREALIKFNQECRAAGFDCEQT